MEDGRRMSEEERPEAVPEKSSVREPETASGRLHTAAVKIAILARACL